MPDPRYTPTELTAVERGALLHSDRCSPDLYRVVGLIVDDRLASERERICAELRGFDGEDGHPGEFISVNEAQAIVRGDDE